MICIHCGSCCYEYVVVIIKEEFINLNIKSIEEFPEEAFTVKNGNTPCPHLYWNDGNSQCNIHDKPWYNETPCFEFGQIESNPKNTCRIGKWILERRKRDFRFNYELKCKTSKIPESVETFIKNSTIGGRNSNEK